MALVAADSPALLFGEGDVLWLVALIGSVESALYRGAGALLIPRDGAQASIQEEALKVRWVQGESRLNVQLCATSVLRKERCSGQVVLSGGVGGAGLKELLTELVELFHSTRLKVDVR